MGLDKFLDSVKSGIKKVGDKAEEIVNSKEAKEFMEKAKDVAIDVGVKVTDVAEELGDRAKEAMHKVAEKNEEKKATANSGEEATAVAPVAEAIEVVEGEVVEEDTNQ